MTDAERLARLESMQLSNEKNISVLASSVKHTKEAIERMDKTQAEVSATLKTMSEALVHQHYIRKEVDDMKNTLRKQDEHGSTREQSLDKRVGEIEEIIKYVNFKILGAVIAAVLAVILK